MKSSLRQLNFSANIMNHTNSFSSLKLNSQSQLILQFPNSQKIEIYYKNNRLKESKDLHHTLHTVLSKSTNHIVTNSQRIKISIKTMNQQNSKVHLFSTFYQCIYIKMCHVLHIFVFFIFQTYHHQFIKEKTLELPNNKGIQGQHFNIV